MQVEEVVSRRIEALRAAGMPVPRRKILHQQAVHVSVDGRKVNGVCTLPTVAWRRHHLLAGCVCRCRPPLRPCLMSASEEQDAHQ